MDKTKTPQHQLKSVVTRIPSPRQPLKEVEWAMQTISSADEERQKSPVLTLERPVTSARISSQPSTENNQMLVNNSKTSDEMASWSQLPESHLNCNGDDNHTCAHSVKANTIDESFHDYCRSEIQALRLTVQDQSKRIEDQHKRIEDQNGKINELTEKLHWLQNDKLSFAPAHDSSDDEKREKRAASDTALLLLRLAYDEMEFLNNSEKSKSYRKKKREPNRKAMSAEFLISEEEKKLNEIQKVLSNHMYGDDVFKFFRYFHPNPEAHVSDFLRRYSAYEQFNQAFAELRKMGTSSFNPKSIHTCLIQIRCRKFADLIEEHVIDKAEISSPSTSKDTSNHGICFSDSNFSITESRLQVPSDNGFSNNSNREIS